MIDVRTKQAKMMLRQAAALLENIEKHSHVLSLKDLRIELFLLQNVINPLTNKVNSAILTQDEAGDESILRVETLEDIDNKVEGNG